jgi:hypothetical protein
MNSDMNSKKILEIFRNSNSKKNFAIFAGLRKMAKRSEFAFFDKNRDCGKYGVSACQSSKSTAVCRRIKASRKTFYFHLFASVKGEPRTQRRFIGRNARER